MKASTNISVIYKIIATLGGIGYIPVAPGTAGTLVAALAYYLLPDKLFTNAVIMIPILLLITLISVFITGKAEKGMSKDDSRIVLDEFVGFFFAVFFLPVNLVLLIIAFILFRILDILKPVPVNLVQKFKGGWGIMADDIVAGILTNVCLRILILILVAIFPKI